MKNLVILGSTGSIGKQTLEVIKENKEKLSLVGIAAKNNYELLAKQALEFSPQFVVIENEAKYKELKQHLNNFKGEIWAGKKAVEELAAVEQSDTVVTAVVGFDGLIPTISAIKHGKNIALANKETLVVAGQLIMDLAKEKGVVITPVDSEHSAIFQSLTGEDYANIEKIYLTASGGPFRGKTLDELRHVTKKDALKHPNWSMGQKITIDSATLMNKGLEAIEAKWLFNLKPEQIDIIVHPQSIIHSIVQFIDGSMKAQMGLPDMKLPIQYALSYPERFKNSFERFDFTKFSLLTFEKPDTEVFRCLAIALDAMKNGGIIPCIMNAANEIAVEAFLNEKINFLQIPDIIQNTISSVNNINSPSVEDLLECDKITRQLATEKINRLKQ